MEQILVYITTADKAEAEAIALAALEQRLAACANIFDSMHSLYWWQGKLEQSRESVLILKSMAGLFPALRQLVRDKHSYETPCIVALPLLDGDEDYLDWIRDSCLPSNL